MIPPSVRILTDPLVLWLAGDLDHIFWFGVLMALGALAAMFWLGRQSLRPAPSAQREPSPQLFEEAGVRDHSRAPRQHVQPVQCSPELPPGVVYGRRPAPIAQALRHTAIPLPTVKRTAGSASKVLEERTTVVLDLRAQQQTAVLPVVGGERR